MAGAYAAPILMKKGKRWAIIALNVVLIGVYALIAFTPINVVIQCIGKFIQGIAAGAFSVICPTFISELAPVELQGPIGGLNQAGVTFGILVPNLMGIPIPGEI